MSRLTLHQRIRQRCRQPGGGKRQGQTHLSARPGRRHRRVGQHLVHERRQLLGPRLWPDAGASIRSTTAAWPTTIKCAWRTGWTCSEEYPEVAGKDPPSPDGVLRPHPGHRRHRGGRRRQERPGILHHPRRHPLPPYPRQGRGRKVHRPASVLWERYGSDFVCEDGEWKYLHEHVCPDMVGGMDVGNWAHDEYQPDHRPQSPETMPPPWAIPPGGRSRPPAYALLGAQGPQNTVPWPEPYETLDNDNTYTPFLKKKVMPFGPASSPAAFQKLPGCGLAGSFLSVFVIRCIISSR